MEQRFGADPRSGGPGMRPGDGPMPPDITDIRLISSKNADFFATEGGFVGMTLDGKTYDRVTFCRTFPFSDPDRFISVRTADGMFYELGIIESISDLDDAAAKLIGSALALRYFVPKISAITGVRNEQGLAFFDVKTDRGPCSFVIRGGSDAVSKLSDTRLIISDISGNRFEIEDISKLSARDMKKLDSYI